MQIYQLQRLWRFRLYLRLTMYLYDVVKEPTRSRVRCAPVMVLNAFQLQDQTLAFCGVRGPSKPV
jgi:hypothetical protein